MKTMIVSSPGFGYPHRIQIQRKNLQARSPSAVGQFKAGQSYYSKAEITTSADGNAKRRCQLIDLYKELVPYEEAWSWQKSLLHQRLALTERNEDHSDMLLVLQHPSVYTMGAGSSDKYLKFDIDNAPHNVYRTERGGEVTYHGPGQLVMYPILNLRYQKKDLHWYLRSLEEVVIRALSAAFSIYASRLEGFTGVWVGNQKIAAIGVRVTRWVSYHGLALNVTTDLTPFERIVPCGIRDRQVGNICGLLRHSSDITTCDVALIDVIHDYLLREFSEVFQVYYQPQTISGLKLLKENV